MRALQNAALALFLMGTTAFAQDYDIVISGGRVIDPETGLDAIRDVGIEGSTITAISETALDGENVIDATGLIVSPGFIDLHSHSVVDLSSNRLQAYDGVTTALELESGLMPVGDWYEATAAKGVLPTSRDGFLDLCADCGHDT